MTILSSAAILRWKPLGDRASVEAEKTGLALISRVVRLVSFERCLLDLPECMQSLIIIYRCTATWGDIELILSRQQKIQRKCQVEQENRKPS